MMPHMNSPFMPSPFGNNNPLMGFHQMMHNSAFQRHQQPLGFHDFMAFPPQQPPMMGFGGNRSFSSSSSYNTGGGAGRENYSKSVTTSTRSVNGVVETVKITKITDENVSSV